MSYLTLEVEIDNGRIIPNEPDKLPKTGKGLLTVLESRTEPADPEKAVRIRAFLELSKSLNLDEAKARAWMDQVRDARR
ncbi:MAG TPA: hypothetical protein VGR89_04285 [Puia sp.]|nr:hypothetical protein [Puia sp.]